MGALCINLPKSWVLATSPTTTVEYVSSTRVQFIKNSLSVAFFPVIAITHFGMYIDEVLFNRWLTEKKMLFLHGAWKDKGIVTAQNITVLRS